MCHQEKAWHGRSPWLDGLRDPSAGALACCRGGSPLAGSRLLGAISAATEAVFGLAAGTFSDLHAQASYRDSLTRLAPMQAAHHGPCPGVAHAWEAAT